MTDISAHLTQIWLRDGWDRAQATWRALTPEARERAHGEMLANLESVRDHVYDADEPDDTWFETGSADDWLLQAECIALLRGDDDALEDADDLGTCVALRRDRLNLCMMCGSPAISPRSEYPLGNGMVLHGSARCERGLRYECCLDAIERAKEGGLP